MKKYEHCCEDMAAAIQNEESPMHFSEKYRRFGLLVLDGGSSYIAISHCPWCGAVLPKSLRTEWHSALQSMGIDPGEDEVPLLYQDGAWYGYRSQ